MLPKSDVVFHYADLGGQAFAVRASHGQAVTSGCWVSLTRRLYRGEGS
jgi:hypothetical protein